jgi:hypothetical protein
MLIETVMPRLSSLFLVIAMTFTATTNWSAEPANRATEFLPVEGAEREKVLAGFTDNERAAVKRVIRIGLSTVLVQLGPVAKTKLMGGIRVMKNEKGFWSLVTKEDWEG